MRILVTGGAGYIGSHTCVELLNAGYEIIVVDNLSNSSLEALRRVKVITGKDFPFYQVDLCNYEDLDNIFRKEKIDAVIHFAGLKAVGESVQIPLSYYRNNLFSTINLLECMKKHNIKNFVFSSSATVYGNPQQVPITEDFPTKATNPYGRTKLMIEEILRDLYNADEKWNIAILRYFNPVGAHASGLIGEDPLGVPNNLMPYITQVAIGKLPELRIFGNDYNTPDGTGVRDYIHVVDLAIGHICTLEKLKEECGLVIYNLGTGKGISVLEMVKAFEKVSGRKVPYRFVDRRPGDVPVCYADPSKANRELNWVAKKTLHDMCKDAWNFQVKNPHGYQEILLGD